MPTNYFDFDFYFYVDHLGHLKIKIACEELSKHYSMATSLECPSEKKKLPVVESQGRY